jgi:hypothetical protein
MPRSWVCLLCVGAKNLHFWFNIPIESQQGRTTLATACKDSVRMEIKPEMVTFWKIFNSKYFEDIDMLLCWWIFKSELILACLQSY